MKALGEFATMCYNKGTQDVLIGVSIGAIFGVVIAVGFEVIELWKDKKKTENQIKAFNDFVKKKKEKELEQGLFSFYSRLKTVRRLQQIVLF